MDKEEIVSFWIDTAEKDYQTMKHLYDSHDYHWSLFIGHLVIEKLLKAIYVAHHKGEVVVPRSHDLLALAEKAGVDTDQQQKDLLDLITTFNISARYPDYKRSFYLKCAREYTTERIQEIEELRTWLLHKLQIR